MWWKRWSISRRASSGIDPAELRRRNTIPAAAMPFKTALVYTYDCGDFAKNLEDCLRQGGLCGLPGAPRGRARERGKLRGIGVANTVEASNAGLIEHAEIRFDPTGTVTVAVGTHDHGQGHQTTFRQIISDKLGIDPSRIRFSYGDTDEVMIGTGTFGSRSTACGGAAMLMAAEKVIAKGRRLAAHLMEAGESDIEFRDGKFVVAGTDKAVDLAEVARAAFVPARLPKGMEPGLFETGTFDGGERTYPNGCHIAEVEIDAGDRRGRARALHRGRRRRPHDQPAPGRGAAARRHRAGRRPGADGAHRLRRRRASS